MALFNIDGEFFAINHICPHRGGPLADGRLEGSIVTCPWHGAAYAVKIEGSDVYVGWLKAPPG